jgi:hypothetical protein
MNATTNYYIDTGRGLRPATPARIVCYPEGHGEWTIHAEDDAGQSIRDFQGDYPAAIWHCAENDCEPITVERAVALACELRQSMGMPSLPIYTEAGGYLSIVERF